MLSYQAFCESRKLVYPDYLVRAIDIFQTTKWSDFAYHENLEASDPRSVAWIVDLLRDAIDPPPSNLMPLFQVDDSSIACVVCFFQDEIDDAEDEYIPLPVVRWHLKNVPPEYQAELIDRDAFEYLRSFLEELEGRENNRQKVLKLAKRYKAEVIEKRKRPKSTDLRPVQLASQNVIIGLVTLQHDPFFDGLRVPAYATCEVPHLAANEADRALIALIMCDAFQNGGTMEIRFGSHNNELPVPPSVRRYARAIGIKVGQEDENAITPIEARNLFLAVTPLPDDLRGRAMDIIDLGIIAPERLCFTLMSGIWTAAELDYIVSTSPRVSAIFEGGSDVTSRLARQSELETCRAALMVGMYLKRLEVGAEPAESLKGVRVFEDQVEGLIWSISENDGVVGVSTKINGPLPWSFGVDNSDLIPNGRELLIVPRGLPQPVDFALVTELIALYPDMIVVLLTSDDMKEIVPPDIPILACPQRLGQLDLEIERRFGLSRVGRS